VPPTRVQGCAWLVPLSNFLYFRACHSFSQHKQSRWLLIPQDQRVSDGSAAFRTVKIGARRGSSSGHSPGIGWNLDYRPRSLSVAGTSSDRPNEEVRHDGVTRWIRPRIH
jgi:hypothetical protein